MTLTDAGPLIALIVANDPAHEACRRALQRLPREPMLTTWPCFTEAMYLAHRAAGYRAQRELWTLLEAGRLRLYRASARELARMSSLMETYRDTPMDLADASLIAVAERLALRRVFSLDSDFHVYRLADGSALEVVP